MRLPSTLSPIGELIQGVEIPPSSKVTWPEIKCISIRRTRIVDLGWVNIRACNSFVSGPKFTKIFPNPVEIVIDQVCFLFLIFRLLPKIFTVKVESCPKLGRIFDFLALPNFRGAGPQKLYLSDHAHLMARHAESIMKYFLHPQNLQARLRQILSQFLTPFKKL